jgi:multiple sugar transport system permease protein/sn-glycerol 3-phosphate transport system permease protein
VSRPVVRGGDLLALAAASLLGLPFLLALLVSLMPPDAFLAREPALWPLRLDNYARALEAAPFDRYLLNSLLVAGAVTAGSLLTAILAAYACARLEFKGRDLAFLAIVATLLIPSHVTLVPNYLTMAAFDLVDSYPALVLPSLASGFVCFFLRQQFRNIPREFDDAALVDGAGRLQILRLIVVPLARPAIAAMAIFQFLAEWTSFLWPLVVTTSPDMRTLEVGLAALHDVAIDDGNVNWPVVMAGAVLVMAPTLLLFVLAERQLVRGFAPEIGR